MNHLKYSSKLEELEKRTFRLLAQYGKEDLVKELEKKLSEKELTDPIKIAFVGQYNAGKSTIIQALTGDKNILIDSDVATSETTEFNYHQVKIIDTPGILAGKMEVHDELTQEALKSSDLIVYVLTSQLFDDLTFENFIDLAYIKKYEQKMLLVINKMSMEAGEFHELVKNYNESMISVFQERGYDFPYQPVYIDAADYLEGNELDEEELKKLSNFDELIESFSDFITIKGELFQKFDTPVRLLRHEIEQALIYENDPSFGLILKRYEGRLNDFRHDLIKGVDQILTELQNDIVSDGYQISDLIGEADQVEFSKGYDNFEKNLDVKLEAVFAKIQELIALSSSHLGEELSDINDDIEIINYKKDLEIKISKGLNSTRTKDGSNLENKTKLLQYLNAGANKLTDITGSGNAKGALARSSEIAGSQGHLFTKEIGHFFNYKFKSWEAVNITKKIGNIAKFAPAAIGAFQVGMEIHNIYQENKRIRMVTSEKNKMNLEIFELSKEFRKKVQESFDEYLANTIDKKMAEIKEQKELIIRTNQKNTRFSEAIRKLDSEYVDFIDMLNQNDEVNTIIS